MCFLFLIILETFVSASELMLVNVSSNLFSVFRVGSRREPSCEETAVLVKLHRVLMRMVAQQAVGNPLLWDSSPSAPSLPVLDQGQKL